MNIGHIIKAAWVILALSCVSYVGFGFGAARNAEAATLEQINALETAFSGMKLRVITTRDIRFWDAQANQIAHCWKFSVPAKVATPPKGQGFYAHQWDMQTTSAEVTEEQCYAQP
jgi:hypothetical protein